VLIDDISAVIIEFKFHEEEVNFIRPVPKLDPIIVARHQNTQRQDRRDLKRASISYN